MEDGAGVESAGFELPAESPGGPSRGLTLGLSLFPEHGDTLEAVLKAADDALYQAKAAGRNRIIMSRK